MYNNLGEQRELIEREIEMLVSVQEGFDTSASSQHTKVAPGPALLQAQYVAHLEDLLRSVREAKKRAK